MAINIQETLVGLRSEFTAQIVETESLQELENLRVSYLGRNGKLTLLIKEIGDLPPEMKKKLGILINETKSTLHGLMAAKKNELLKKDDWFDYSMPGKEAERGHLHLITKAINEITQIFNQIGFVRMRYPEVEWDWFAFTALNFPQNHPARDDWETFFLEEKSHSKYGKMLLSPHTSSGQVREMKRTKPPIRMLNIAKNYRRELDASHVVMLHQFEGLVIDKGVNITHLKGTLDYFVKQFYGPKIKTRLRPHNFKFTEPSFEVDVTCMICGGKGCKVCKEGWLEQAGAGMVHPNVLKSGGIDPKVYSGFAFGWGVERAYMMKPGLKLPDIRLIYQTDLRILKQL